MFTLPFENIRIKVWNIILFVLPVNHYTAVWISRKSVYYTADKSTVVTAVLDNGSLFTLTKNNIHDI